MKLTFESNLAYQQKAIQAVVNLFEGQTLVSFQNWRID